MRIHKVNIAIDFNSIHVPNSYYVKPKEVSKSTNYNFSKHKQQAIDMQRMVTTQNTQMNQENQIISQACSILLCSYVTNLNDSKFKNCNVYFN